MNETRNSGRDIAVLFAGVAAGVLGSRLLPPLIASATGSARASKSGDPFDILVADHRQILSLLDGMTTHHDGSALRPGQPLHDAQAQVGQARARRGGRRIPDPSP